MKDNLADVVIKEPIKLPLGIQNPLIKSMISQEHNKE